MSKIPEKEKLEKDIDFINSKINKKCPWERSVSYLSIALVKAGWRKVINKKT